MSGVVRAVLFDHDGTLVDSELTHYRMWANVLQPHGIAFTLDEYIEHHVGVPTPGNAARILSDYPSLPLTAADLVQAKQAATRAFLATNAFPLMPDARETLQYFAARGVQTGIVSGAAARVVASTVASHRLDELVSVVVSGHDVAANKPAPDCYRFAMRKLGVEPAECVAVEDTESGVAAAVAAGITCIAIASAMSKTHDFRHAAATVANLSEARAWIAESGRGGPDSEARRHLPVGR